MISIAIGIFFGSTLASAIDFGKSPSPVTSSSMGLTGTDKSQSFTCEDEAYEDSAWHEHGYRNNTNPDEGYESYLRIFNLRVYLDQNFVDNVDMSNLY